MFDCKIRFSSLFILFLALVFPEALRGQAIHLEISVNPNDWPMYNRDIIGTRSNVGEKTLTRENVHTLEEKWCFPRKDSDEKIGVVTATVVVNGHVYFGTGKPATFYKLAPDGSMKWAYKPKEKLALFDFGLPTVGFVNAGLVTQSSVFACDLGGTIHALDRMTGKALWTVDTRGAPFPGAHPSNCIYAAPILADGNLIIAGGGYEHVVALDPFKNCCTGRGFVTALDPLTGKSVWKYEVGPEPKKLVPQVQIKDQWGTHSFKFGPSTSSVWCTPSFDAETHTLFFGTDTHNSPRQPTPDDPKLYTKHSCALIAIDSRTGKEKWITQINPGDVWNYGMRAYDDKTGLYKDQSIGDTPKIFNLSLNGKERKVIGFGCKNGGFYILDSANGEILARTPTYSGPPLQPSAKSTPLDPRVLALPGPLGGLQTGCATDGYSIFTNGVDHQGLLTNPDKTKFYAPPSGGRVVSLSMDTRKENWRHERPKVNRVSDYTDIGDPVASGIAVANGVLYFTTTVSNKLVALDTANGKVIKEMNLGPVWCGPTVSRGRVYVGTGNQFLLGNDPRESYFPKNSTGTVRSFGLPGEDEVSRMKSGNE